MNLTDWFPLEVNPFYNGTYQLVSTISKSGYVYARWDGEHWRDDIQGYKLVARPWRGLTQPN